VNTLDEQALAGDQALYDDIAKIKAPEQCVYCGQDVLFDDVTECWLARQTGYHCPDADPGTYGIQCHEV